MGAEKAGSGEPSSPWVVPLGRDIVLEGRLKFSGSMVLNGQFTGTIVSDGQLTLGREAAMKGDIQADAVRVEGSVKGNIAAKTKVHLLPSAQVDGDIQAVSLIVEDGAFVTGKIQMKRP